VALMSYDPQQGYPRVVPVLAYEDVAAAIDWLSNAFGFHEVLRWTDPAGVVRVAELDSDGGAIMLESREGTSHAHGCHFVLVMVDRVDEHFRRAREAGAKVIEEPEDRPWGLRQYRVEDPGGHRWEFSQHLRDVRPQDWGATPAAFTRPAAR
jgi:uncharacterized glyoxalase superfamily protein PhnB